MFHLKCSFSRMLSRCCLLCVKSTCVSCHGHIHFLVVPTVLNVCLCVLVWLCYIILCDLSRFAISLRMRYLVALSFKRFNV